MTQEVSISLSIAIFCELFWLDLIPVGTYIPPQGLFITLSSITITYCLGLHSPAEIGWVICACLPFGYFGSKLEEKHRIRQNNRLDLLMSAVEAEPEAVNFSPGRVIFMSIASMALTNALFFLSCCLGLYFLLAQVFKFFDPNSFLSWPILWLCATIPASLSMRVVNERVIFLLSGAVIVLLLTLDFLLKGL